MFLLRRVCLSKYSLQFEDECKKYVNTRIYPELFHIPNILKTVYIAHKIIDIFISKPILLNREIYIYDGYFSKNR